MANPEFQYRRDVSTKMHKREICVQKCITESSTCKKGRTDGVPPAASRGRPLICFYSLRSRSAGGSVEMCHLLFLGSHIKARSLPGRIIYNVKDKRAPMAKFHWNDADYTWLRVKVVNICQPTFETGKLRRSERSPHEKVVVEVGGGGQWEGERGEWKRLGAESVLAGTKCSIKCVIMMLCHWPPPGGSFLNRAKIPHARNGSRFIEDYSKAEPWQCVVCVWSPQACWRVCVLPCLGVCELVGAGLFLEHLVLRQWHASLWLT